jgi:hypothetical protein
MMVRSQIELSIVVYDQGLPRNVLTCTGSSFAGGISNSAAHTVQAAQHWSQSYSIQAVMCDILYLIVTNVWATPLMPCPLVLI